MYLGALLLGMYMFITVLSFWSLYHYKMFQFIPTSIFLQFLLSYISVATSAFLWLPFAWCIFFHEKDIPQILDFDFNILLMESSVSTVDKIVELLLSINLLHFDWLS